MRIVSLVPHATELLFALGLGDDVVGVTHECDFPPAARGLPQVTRNRLADGLGTREIDEAVRGSLQQHASIYELDEALVVELAPTLIVTQELCAVCAVTADEVRAVAALMPAPADVVVLDPHTIGEVLGDIRTLAGHTDRKDEGVELLRSLADRIDRVKVAVRGGERPKVLAIEWLDPLMSAGHWVPQLIDLAGGEDVLGLAGERSEVVPWELAQATAPEVVVVMPCGRDADDAAEEAGEFIEQLTALGAREVVAVDASAYFSRPGPRLVHGLELLASILHPTAGIEPPEDSAYWVVGSPRGY